MENANAKSLMKKTKEQLVEIILKQDTEILEFKKCNEALKADVEVYSTRCKDQLEENSKVINDNKRLKEELRKANQLILDQQNGMDENASEITRLKQELNNVNKKNKKLYNLQFFLFLTIAIMLGIILMF